MKLITVSKFSWRSHNYEVGEIFEAEDVIAQRMIKEGSVKKTDTSKDETQTEPAVETQSKPKAETVLDAGDIKEKPAVVQKSKIKSKETSVSKKKKK